VSHRRRLNDLYIFSFTACWTQPLRVDVADVVDSDYAAGDGDAGVYVYEFSSVELFVFLNFLLSKAMSWLNKSTFCVGFDAICNQVLSQRVVNLLE